MKKLFLLMVSSVLALFGCGENAVEPDPEAPIQDERPAEEGAVSGDSESDFEDSIHYVTYYMAPMPEFEPEVKENRSEIGELRKNLLSDDQKH